MVKSGKEWASSLFSERVKLKSEDFSEIIVLVSSETFDEID